MKIVQTYFWLSIFREKIGIMEDVLLDICVKAGEIGIKAFPYPHLNVATKYNMVEYVKMFLEMDVNLKWNGTSPFENAINNKNTEIIQLIVGTNRVNQKSLDDEMKKACINGDLEIIKIVGYASTEFSPFFKLVCQKDHSDVVDYMLPFCNRKERIEGLLAAGGNNQRYTVKSIIESGIYDNNVLYEIVKHNNYDCLHEIIYLADFDQKFTSDESTALMISIQNGFSESFDILKKVSYPNNVDAKGHNAFMLAIKAKNLYYCMELISVTDINIQNVMGENALFLSIINDMPAVTLKLLEDPRINTKLMDISENTLLGISTKSPSNIFDIVLDIDIQNLNILNKENKSPLYLSIDNNNAYAFEKLFTLTNLSNKMQRLALTKYCIEKYIKSVLSKNKIIILIDTIFSKDISEEISKHIYDLHGHLSYSQTFSDLCYVVRKSCPNMNRLLTIPRTQYYDDCQGFY